jgi:hypothetical protein
MLLYIHVLLVTNKAYACSLSLIKLATTCMYNIGCMNACSIMLAGYSKWWLLFGEVCMMGGCGEHASLDCPMHSVLCNA